MISQILEQNLTLFYGGMAGRPGPKGGIGEKGAPGEQGKLAEPSDGLGKEGQIWV